MFSLQSWRREMQPVKVRSKILQWLPWNQSQVLPLPLDHLNLCTCYTKFCIGFKIRKSRCRTTLTLRFGLLKMIFECSIARCDVGLGRAIVQCQKNPLRKPKLSINRAILSAHFSAVKFCIGFFCWIGFFWFCIGFFCNWMLQLLLKIVAKNLNYASLHVCT